MFQKLSDRFNNLFARFLLVARLSSFVGRRQAEYVARMIEMFERGDLTEALKHAIPLNNDLSQGLSRISLSAPKPRSSLEIAPYKNSSTSSIGVSGDLMTDLRQMYREAFNRLIGQNRIEEAAFVLAELLQANEEAVSFLEKHGKLRLAAELAEARDLMPGLIVRQWFVAGEKERAVLIARKMGAFADAVSRLEHSDKEKAKLLRVLWAQTLARAGDYTAAIDVISLDDETRELLAHWFEKALAVGGVSAARMLVKKVAVFPEKFDEVKGVALELLEDEGAERAMERNAFAKALAALNAKPELKPFARISTRAVIRDIELGYTDDDASVRQNLIDLADDGALRSDVPAISKKQKTSLKHWPTPWNIEVESSDVGAIAISDAAFLPSGKTVVALGEAGVRLLARDGRTVAHFDKPAHKLVVSDNGDRAIALAQRGEVWKLSRIDFLSRKADDWVDANIKAFAPDYDGSVWFVACDRDFYVIDATAKTFEALWRVPEVDVVTIARSQREVSFLSYQLRVENWTYSLPSMRLISRNQIANELPGNKGKTPLPSIMGVSPNGSTVELQSYTLLERPPARIGERGLSWRELIDLNAIESRIRIYKGEALIYDATLDERSFLPSYIATSDTWLASSAYDNNSHRVWLRDWTNTAIKVDLSLARSMKVSVRLQPLCMTVADDCGRVLVFSLEERQLLRNLRLG